LKQSGLGRAVGWDSGIPSKGGLDDGVIRLRSEDRAGAAFLSLPGPTDNLKRGKFSMPPDADPADFLLSGGKVVAKPRPVETQEAATEVRALGQVFATYAEMLTRL
jgi:hypothetical protein